MPILQGVRIWNVCVPVFRNNLLSDGYIAAVPVLNYHVRILSPLSVHVGESRVGGKENKGRVSEASVNRVRMRNVSS